MELNWVISFRVSRGKAEIALVEVDLESKKNNTFIKVIVFFLKGSEFDLTNSQK